MNTKSAFRAALAVLSISCAMHARADLLPDPLGPIPKDVSRAAKASVTSAAAPSNSGNAKPAPAPAVAPAAPAASPTPTKAAPVVSVAPPSAPTQVPTTQVPATHERSTATNTSGATFRQLDELRTQNALLTEMVKGAEMKAKLSNQGTTAGTSGTVAATPPAFQVLSVDGLDDELTAVVTLPNGTTFKAREGLQIAGLGKVKSITRDQVIVTTKAGPRPLDFAPKASFPGVR